MLTESKPYDMILEEKMTEVAEAVPASARGG